jgi:hypothetical protein
MLVLKLYDKNQLKNMLAKSNLAEFVVDGET